MTDAVAHRFVDVVPDTLDQGVVYVCIPYTTAVHLCMCGCGMEVVTPIKPTEWRLSFNGVTISLHPSIGNWSFPCRSHYWITDGRVRWDRKWKAAEVTRARQLENADRERAFASAPTLPSRLGASADHPAEREHSKRWGKGCLNPGFWLRRWNWHRKARNRD